MRIASIVRDRKKTLMIRPATAYKRILEGHELYAAGTTGMKVVETTGLPVHCFKSGPLGGDQQVGIMISEDNIDLVTFLRGLLSMQPHGPDMTALIRLSDVYETPLTTNIGSAEIPLRGIEAGSTDFREVIHEGNRRPLVFQRTLMVISTILWYIL